MYVDTDDQVRILVTYDEGSWLFSRGKVQRAGFQRMGHEVYKFPGLHREFREVMNEYYAEVFK